MTSRPDDIRAALRALPTSVVLVAADIDGATIRMLASSFTSVSLEPPLVSVAFMRTSSTLPRLLEAPAWGISLLSSAMSEPLEQLSRPAPIRFSDVELSRCDNGAKFLPESPLSLTVTPDQQVEAGDHVIVVLRVIGIVGDTSRPPLVLHNRTVHHLTAAAVGA